MAKQAKTAPVSHPEDNLLAASIETLAAEIGLLREVIDSLREDFSWVTRNGLPVQLIEQPLKKPDATDRAGMPPEENGQQESVDGIFAALEAIAQGQLEVVLTALDGIQQQILAALERRPSHGKKVVSTTEPPVARDTAANATEPPEKRPTTDPLQPGRLF